MNIEYKSWRLSAAEFFASVCQEGRLLSRLLLTWNAKQAPLRGATYNTPENRSERFLRAAWPSSSIVVPEDVLIRLLVLLKQMVRVRSSLLSRFLGKDAALWVLDLFEFGVERHSKLFLSYEIRFHLIRLWMEIFRNGWIKEGKDSELCREVTSLLGRLRDLDLSKNEAAKDIRAHKMLETLKAYEDELLRLSFPTKRKNQTRTA